MGVTCLYGSGPAKVAETANCSLEEAKEHIKTYFNTFPKLKKWLKKAQEDISGYGYIYSVFGRKRRLPNVNSPDKSVSSHEVRSGVNFLIQSVASDINLLACIDMNNWLKRNNMKTKIFGMVHDSILAEVHKDEKEAYINQLAKFTQMDRGISIPGAPIGLDVEIGSTYAF